MRTFKTVFRIRIRIRPDPYFFDLEDPDPDPYFFTDPDPDPGIINCETNQYLLNKKSLEN